MIPQLDFSEIGIVLATMSTGMQALYFFAVILVNAMGILVSDIVIDKKLKTTNPDGEFSWREVALLTICSAIVTMAVISMYIQDFWNAMFMAWVMGLVFRPLLPEIAKLAMDKIKAMIEALFGKYG